MVEDEFRYPPTGRVRAFVDEVKALCERHGLMLVAEQYDGLFIYERTEHDPSPLHFAGIVDGTTER